MSWLEHIRLDARQAFRSIKATPAFALAVIVTLALGIGANSAIFSVLHAVIMRAVPYDRPEQLVTVWEADRFSGTDAENASVPDFYDLRQRARSFSSLAAMDDRQMSLVQPGRDAERVSVGGVSDDFLKTLALRPLLGRSFELAEEQPNGPAVAMISERAWKNRFGGRQNVLGESLQLDDKRYDIVGVLPADVSIPSDETEVWVPLQYSATVGPLRENHVIRVIGRLRPGITYEAAQNEVTRIAAQLEREFPDANTGRSMRVQSLQDATVGNLNDTILLLLSAVALVLIIACVNIANLLLTRATARKREISVRIAIGATRARLFQQMLIETGLMSAIAAVGGLGMAALTLRLLVKLAPAGLPHIANVGLNVPVIAATFVVSIVVALALGTIPVWSAVRVNVNDAIRAQGSRSTTASTRQTRLRTALVVAQVALSVLLLACAGLLVRSFWRLLHVDPGFRSENVVKVQYQLPPTRYPQSFSNYPHWTELQRFNQTLLESAANLPGVVSASIAANHPLHDGFTNSFVIEGREAEQARGQAEVPVRMVSPDYFRTVGIPLVSGRGLTNSDDENAPGILVINQAMVQKYFANTNPIGQRIRFWGSSRTIVGVVGNERFKGVATDAPPAVYPPFKQTPVSAATLLVRANTNATQLIPMLRAEMKRLDPGVAPYGVETLSATLSNSVAQQRFTMLLLGAFAALALLIAAVGVHGVIAYNVVQRTKELGVRIALGSAPGRAVALIVAQGATIAGAGTLLGLVGAAATTRLMRGLLFGTAPTDPVTLVSAAIFALIVAVGTTYIAARKVARIDPIRALSAE